MDSTGGALLVRLDSTGGHLLVGMDSTGGEFSRRNQPEEESGKRSEMVVMRSEMQQEQEPTKALLFSWDHKKRIEAQEKEAKKKQVDRQREMSKRRGHRVKNSTKLVISEMQQEARLGKSYVFEKGLSKEKRPKAAEKNSACGKKLAKNSSMRTKNMKMVGGSGKLMGQQSKVPSQGKKNSMQQLFKDMPNKFDILDRDGNDEKDEIDRGKSAIDACLYTNKGLMDLNTTVAESDKFLRQPADHSATDSVTILGLYSVEDDLEHETGKSATALPKKMIDKEVSKEAESFKDMCNKFDILDCDDDDKKDEMDRGKSAIDACLYTNEGPMGLNTTMAESDKFLLQPADPSTTDSVTILGQYSVENDVEHETGKSATPLTKKRIDKEVSKEAKSFAIYRLHWECLYSKTYGVFEDITLLSSMQFTHYNSLLIPNSRSCSTPKTLQILSLKLTKIAGGLEFPLSVYGVVAARDTVDHNRNILFSCSRSQAQELKPEDPFLHLMGPSRAIVFVEEVDFEMELEVKGTPDKTLICCARKYKGGPCNGVYGSGVSTICFNNIFCTLELCLQPVGPTVQATIVGVKVDGPCPLKYGGLVACYPLSGKFVSTNGRPKRIVNPPSSQIVLLDSKYGAMPKDSDGYINLSRQVVSVEFAGGLNVVIQAYSKSSRIAASVVVPFTPRKSQISQDKRDLGNAQVTVTVAWSLVPTDKTIVALGVA